MSRNDMRTKEFRPDIMDSKGEGVTVKTLDLCSGSRIERKVEDFVIRSWLGVANEQQQLKSTKMI